MSAAASFLPRYTPAQIEAHRRIQAIRARMAASRVATAPAVEEAKPVDPVALYRLAFDSAAVNKARIVTARDKADRMLRLVCHVYGVQRNDVLSPRRFPAAVEARHRLIWLLFRFTTWSMPQIGRYIKRDHTTVLHALERLSALRPNRPHYRDIRPASVHRRYTAQEDASIVSMRAEGKTFPEIAAILNRAPGNVWARHKELTKGAA